MRPSVLQISVNVLAGKLVLILYFDVGVVVGVGVGVGVGVSVGVGVGVVTGIDVGIFGVVF